MTHTSKYTKFYLSIGLFPRLKLLQGNDLNWHVHLSWHIQKYFKLNLSWISRLVMLQGNDLNWHLMYLYYYNHPGRNRKTCPSTTVGRRYYLQRNLLCTMYYLESKWHTWTLGKLDIKHLSFSIMSKRVNQSNDFYNLTKLFSLYRDYVSRQSELITCYNNNIKAVQS